MQFSETGWGYERVEHGHPYQRREDAARDAERNFPEWFPLADPKYGVLCMPGGEGKGSWFLQATRRIPNGEIVTEVHFQDFQPTKRLTSEVKVEMFLS